MVAVSPRELTKYENVFCAAEGPHASIRMRTPIDMFFVLPKDKLRLSGAEQEGGQGRGWGKWVRVGRRNLSIIPARDLEI